MLSNDNFGKDTLPMVPHQGVNQKNVVAELQQAVYGIVSAHVSI